MTTVEHLAERTAMASSSSTALRQIIEPFDEKHDDAHKRLRQDLRDFKIQLDHGLQSMREEIAKDRAEIASLKATPVDATNLILRGRVIVALVLTVVGICAGVWGSTAGLRSDVRDILTRIEAQKTAVDAATKLQEMQSTSLKVAIDEMKRRQELQQYEIQGLKEAILTGKSPLRK